MAEPMLQDMREGAILLADPADDTNSLRDLAKEERAWANSPAKTEPQGQLPLQRMDLLPTQSDRALLQQTQTVPRHLNQIRKRPTQLSRCRQVSRDTHLDQVDMSLCLRPNSAGRL